MAAAKGALGRAAAWISSSAPGYAAGAALVGYDTDLGALALMGLVSGTSLGAAQGVVLARQGDTRLAVAWAAAMPVLFALSWCATRAIGVSVENQFTLLGAAGAVVFALISGLVLARFTPTPDPVRHNGFDADDADDAAEARASGVRRQHEDGRLAARLADLHAGGTVVGSVCTGAILLAQAGLLEGRPATTHRGNLDQLEQMGAVVDREARVVDEGDVLTCGGVTSGLDPAFHIVEREYGAEAADRIAALMEHERRGLVRVTASTQAR